VTSLCLIEETLSDFVFFFSSIGMSIWVFVTDERIYILGNFHSILVIFVYLFKVFSFISSVFIFEIGA